MAKNLKTQTKKSIYESKVNQLDNLGTGIDNFIMEEGLNVLENVIGDFIVRVQRNIQDDDSNVTGTMSEISMKGEGGVINIYGNKHLLYQDRGVSGNENPRPNTPHFYSDKMPPVDVFKKWIMDKNIRLERNEQFRGEPSPFNELTEEEQISKAAWGMAKNIQKKGFKAKNVYSKEIPQLEEELKTELEQFMIQSLVQIIDVKPSGKRIIK
jgi:hypothetical protein